jgi:hypothetical protein
MSSAYKISEIAGRSCTTAARPIRSASTRPQHKAATRLPRRDLFLRTRRQFHGRATPKQLDLIADLAKERGRDVLQEVRQMGLGSLQELTRGEASKIIDALQGR